MADEKIPTEVEEAVSAVKAVYERLEENLDKFDKYLQKSMDTDCLEEFVESYLNMREAGMSFDDAFLTAAEERDITIEEESSE